MNSNKELAEIMFPNIDKTVEFWEEKYPERSGESGLTVTRFAPSPTGFLHIGGVYTSLINEFFARQRNGIFYLRIEDTDQVRIVENGISEIVDTLAKFDIFFNEGAVSESENKGNYGPYCQSKRGEIYQTYAKYLVEQGLAYPCFCSKEDLEKLHEEQVACNSSLLGYGGKYARCRNIGVDEAIERIKNGELFVTRLRAPMGKDVDTRIKANDILRDEIEMDANNIDTILIKQNGLPTYHFAHVIDDHLMHTTHVIRADEWFSSLPLHLQLFKILGFKAPKYAHICPIMKQDGESRRKISKRKDPEARVGYYFEEGFPTVAVKEYLINLINSSFEEWRERNPQLSYTEFPMKLSNMSVSGALFDYVKLCNVSKKIIKNMDEDEIFNQIKKWAKIQSPNFYDVIQSDEEKFKQSITIWHRNRMDIARWGEIEKNFAYLYDSNFIQTLNRDAVNLELPYAKEILCDYLETYDIKDEQSVWFDKMKVIAEKYNYAVKPKDYKLNPNDYNGSIVEVSMLIRECITGQKDSPDIYQISQYLGEQEVRARIEKICKN